MRFSVILRFASAVVLLGAMSSFSGCEKTSVRPTPGKNCQKPGTTASPATPAGNS